MAEASQLLDQFTAPIAGQEDVHLSVGSDAGGHARLTDVDEATLGQWLACMSHNTVGMDDKARAAYLIGYVAWYLAMDLATLRLAGVGVPDVTATQIMAALEWYHWEEDGESGEAVRFALRFVTQDEAVYSPLNLDGVRALIEAAHAPLIERLYATTRLGRSALWRLVADAVAVSWLNVGQRLGRESEAMDEAMAIIRAPGSPLHNKQTGFVEIVADDPDNPGEALGCGWFRARGGCCRYYTTEGAEGDWCTTCVLRPEESRNQLLQNQVRKRALSAA
jgi:hypothetical protein